MRSPLTANDRGFTLLEVIMVMVLIAIFAVLAVSRQYHTDMTLRADAEILKAHLRYAQMRAISTDSGWGLSYDAAAGDYWLFPVSRGPSQRITLPGEAQSSVNIIDSGVSIAEGSFSLIFDPWGRPDTTHSTLAFNARQATLNLVKTGESNQIITIRQNTGFIQ